jgi:hypothetical protein
MFIVQCRVRIVVVFTAIINQSIEPLLFINLVIRVGVCSIQLDQLLAADRWITQSNHASAFGVSVENPFTQIL